MIVSQRKNPGVAAIISLILPAFGLLYAESVGTFVGYWLLMLGAWSVHPVIFLALYICSVFDSYGRAKAWNERQQQNEDRIYERAAQLAQLHSRDK